MVLSAGILLAAALVGANVARADETYVPFEGEKSAWHEGFVRDDFVTDEESLAITSFKLPGGEKFGVKDPAKGQRRHRSVAGQVFVDY